MTKACYNIIFDFVIIIINFRVSVGGHSSLLYLVQ